MHNLDAILTECGDQIDSVWLGSLDARISMNMPTGSFFGTEPEWLDAVKVFEAALAKHNQPASGLAFGTPEMRAAMSKGRSLLFCSADIFALMSTMGELAATREEFPAKNHSLKN